MNIDLICCTILFAGNKLVTNYGKYTATSTCDLSTLRIQTHGYPAKEGLKNFTGQVSPKLMNLDKLVCCYTPRSRECVGFN